MATPKALTQQRTSQFSIAKSTHVLNQGSKKINHKPVSYNIHVVLYQIQPEGKILSS